MAGGRAGVASERRRERDGAPTAEWAKNRSFSLAKSAKAFELIAKAMMGSGRESGPG